MKESLNTEFQELEQALQREQLRSRELEDQLSRLMSGPSKSQPPY